MERQFVLPLVSLGCLSLLGLPNTSTAQTTSPPNLQGVVDGLTFTRGTFYPTHSIVGLTYDTNSNSYTPPSDVVTPAPSPGFVFNPAFAGYPDTTHLPNIEAILSNWNGLSSQAKHNWLAGATPTELAALFLGLPEGKADPSQPSTPVNGADLLEYVSEEWAGTPHFKNLLAAIPQNKIAGALTSMNWIEFVDLTGFDLTEWDTTGQTLAYINFVGSNFTQEQLNNAALVYGCTF